MAAINIYVGNLSFDTNEDQLKELFETYGQVESATIISDKFTGRPRGFGFVKMPEREDGTAPFRNSTPRILWDAA